MKWLKRFRCSNYGSKKEKKVNYTRESYYDYFCFRNLGGCLYCKGTFFDKKISSEGLDNNKETVKDTKQEIEASLVMVGDALIHSAIYEDAYTGSGYDFRSIFVKIKPLL